MTILKTTKGRTNLKRGTFHSALNLYLNCVSLNIISHSSKHNIAMSKKRILSLWEQSIAQQKYSSMQITIVQERKIIGTKEANTGAPIHVEAA